MVWSAPHHHGHKNGNGKWKDWVVGVSAAVAAAGIAGLVGWIVYTAQPGLTAIPGIEEALKALSPRIDGIELQLRDMYTRNDAYRDADRVARDLREYRHRLEMVEQQRSSTLASPGEPPPPPEADDDGFGSYGPRDSRERIAPHR